ncbi:MAG: DUF1080 domain-containing protein [Thalassotalea sp.]|nr:DUF1080 domain-containing protein [Thalassotalea sp.]MDG2393439.1 DUF1080 domain-containing protein [Thalassotalea sp.]
MKFKSCILFSVLFCQFSFAENDNQWRSLFNGEDLKGWQKYVSFQPESNKHNLKSIHTPRGVNNDPKQVFSVIDGLIRISGEEWGAITTEAEFANFHLKFDIKWGKKKWFPRQDVVRDSGILYYAVGPHGAQSEHWMRSHEFQLQEGDSGDYHSLDGAVIDVKSGEAQQGNWKFYRYDPTLPLRKNISSRVLKQGLHENPSGEWDTMEIIADADTLIHIVNGHEVFRASNSRQKVDGKFTKLDKGKIQIQSEGAEVFYRNILIRTLDTPASTYATSVTH